LFINGKASRVAYIFGLKGNQNYLKSYPLLPKFYEYLDQNLKKKNVEICYTTILEGNQYAQKLLEKKRRIMPHYEFMGKYETFAIKNKSKRFIHDDYKFSKVSDDDIPELVKFINSEGKKCQFFPVMKLEDILNEAFKGINSDSFYLVRKGSDIVAAGAVWDQRDYKQYIVQKYSGLLRIIKAFPLLCIS